MLAIFVRPVSSLGGRSLSATLEPEAAGVHLQDMELVAEAVRQCPSELLRPESPRSTRRRKRGGRQGGAPLVALVEDVEKQFRPGGGHGHESQLVDDQQPAAGDLSLEVERPSFVSGFHQIVGQAQTKATWVLPARTI